MRKIEDYIMIGKDFYNPSNLKEVYIRAYHKGWWTRYEVRIANKNEHYGDIVCKNFADLGNAEREAKRIEQEIEFCLMDKRLHEKDYERSKYLGWSKQDIADAQVVKRLYPNAIKVYKDEDSLRLTICEYGERGRRYYTVNLTKNFFPSLKMNVSVKLDEILKEGMKNE